MMLSSCATWYYAFSFFQGVGLLDFSYRHGFRVFIHSLKQCYYFQGINCYLISLFIVFIKILQVGILEIK